MKKEVANKNLRWYQFIKRWKQAYGDKHWVQTPLVYLLYLFLIGTNVWILFTSNSDHSVTWFAIGVISAAMWFTFVDRKMQHFKDISHQLDIEIAKIDKEMELRAKLYRTGHL